jgi:hypothetical protein
MHEEGVTWLGSAHFPIEKLIKQNKKNRIRERFLGAFAPSGRYPARSPTSMIAALWDL